MGLLRVTLDDLVIVFLLRLELIEGFVVKLLDKMLLLFVLFVN